MLVIYHSRTMILGIADGTIDLARRDELIKQIVAYINGNYKFGMMAMSRL